MYSQDKINEKDLDLKEMKQKDIEFEEIRLKVLSKEIEIKKDKRAVKDIFGEKMILKLLEDF